MTARQRPAASTAGTTPVVAAPVPLSPETGAVVAAPLLLWEDWFQRATPVQRADALALAQQQGLLYVHQLPTLNGNRAQPLHDENAPALALAAVFSGRTEQLPAFTAESLTPLDPDLDEVQRLAVARALATPDVCLIQGLPGTGKSRVVAEIIAQAARRGGRVLFVAAEAAPLDVVLQRLVGRQEVLPLRFLDAAEDAQQLPAWLRGFTLPEQQAAFLARTLAGARLKREEAEACCQRRLREQECWPALRGLAERAEGMQQRLDSLHAQHEHVSGVVAREAEGLPCIGRGMPSGPFAAEFLALSQAHAEALQALAADHATLLEKKSARARERDDLERQCAALDPLYQAKTQGRWWTGAYWRALLHGAVVTEMAGLRERLDRAQAVCAEVEAELAQLGTRRHQLDEQFGADRASVCRDETCRRQQELLGRQHELAQGLQDLRERAQELALILSDAPLRPAGLTRSDVEQAERRWQLQQAQDAQNLQFSRQWLAYLESSGSQLAGRLPQLANVLVGTNNCLLHNRMLREALVAGCDLLIVEEAERLTEVELLRLARHASRLVLVGQALSAVPEPRGSERGTRSLSGLQPLAPACWPRLWQALGAAGGRLPYSWNREGDRLVCQLLALRPEDRQHLESEGLADAADVELRILNHPKGRPSLAQVTFPTTFSFQEAFAFIVRELGEMPLPPAARTTWWQEDGNTCTWCAGPASAGCEVVELEPGLRIAFRTDAAAASWHATRVDFTRADGWDRSRAEGWFAKFLPGHDSGRAVFLQLPYRFTRPLAQAVSVVLFPEDSLWPLLQGEAPTEPHLEFLAVPPLRKSELPREGAGLELDLTSARHSDRIPAELRHGLPQAGFVNYLEAQALVRRLEQLAQRQGALPLPRCGQAQVAVLALFEGQVELLRRLLEQSALLRSHPVTLEIGVPDQMRQRECEVVLLSLTRSHPHRSVPIGADIADLAVALTRARRKLYVFGDPGTLVKRTHWQGPLEHLPAPAAHLEWLRLCRFVHHLQELLCHNNGPVPSNVNGR